MEAIKSDIHKLNMTTVMKQRTIWAMLNTLARNCTLTLTNNTVHTGLIHTFSKQGIIIFDTSCSVPVKKKIPFEEILFLECTNIQPVNKNKFKTDQEISKQTKLKKRQLQQWDGEDSSALTFDLKDYSTWDQFKTNALKFGVVSTYDENLYTTTVPHLSELTEEQVQRAKIVEKELSGKGGRKDEEEEEMDEEALFGAVIGSGRYMDGKGISKKNEKRFKRVKKENEVNKKGGFRKPVVAENSNLNKIMRKEEVKEKNNRGNEKESRNSLQELVGENNLEKIDKLVKCTSVKNMFFDTWEKILSS